MPPKKARAVVQIKPSEYILPCEWLDCVESFKTMEQFITHINVHLQEHLGGAGLMAGNEPDMTCQWRECGQDVEGGTTGYLRHVYFHAFHVKIKCIGALLIQKSVIEMCGLDSQSRNLIPELPEQLMCRWQSCAVGYENADVFYRHVDSHAAGIPEGNVIPGGCTCLWEGCGLNVKNKYKMREHLRCHTQEKVVACPACGGLFSSRTKFFDHLSRQTVSTADKHYKCSHCNKTFAAERLLRDHMRNHVNQYKCPYCDMTCPAPSCLRQHLKYRHSNEKPFKCDLCDYSGKAMADLRKHQDTHSDENTFKCQVSQCGYAARGYQSLANHFKRVHQSMNVATYMCHVCEAQFTRGAVLTKHLKKKHKYIWPSGHSRFRYKLHEDGFWRLQLVRFESVELSESQKNDDSSNQSVSSILGDAEDVEMAEDEENINTNIPQYQTVDPNHFEKIKITNNNQGNANYIVTDDANQSMDQTDGEVTEITLTTDSDGRYIITTPANMSEGQCIPMPENKDFEDSMYNLQMLGEVALNNQKGSSVP